MLFFIQATPFGTGTYLNLTLPYFLSAIEIPCQRNLKDPSNKSVFITG